MLVTEENITACQVAGCKKMAIGWCGTHRRGAEAGYGYRFCWRNVCLAHTMVRKEDF